MLSGKKLNKGQLVNPSVANEGLRCHRPIGSESGTCDRGSAIASARRQRPTFL